MEKRLRNRCASSRSDRSILSSFFLFFSPYLSSISFVYYLFFFLFFSLSPHLSFPFSLLRLSLSLSPPFPPSVAVMFPFIYIMFRANINNDHTVAQTRKEAALRAHEEEEEQQRTPRPDASARPPLPRRTTREGWAEEEPKEAKESEREGRASQSASNREGSQQRRQSFSKNKIVPVSSETKAEAEAGTVVELSVVAGSNADAAAPSNDRAPGLSGRRGSTGSFEQTKSAPEAPALSLPHSMSQGELSGGGVPLRERQEKGTGRSLEKLDTSGLGAGAAATTVAAAGGRRLPPLRREREDGDDRPKEAATPSLLHFSTSQEEIVVSAATEEVGRKTETAEKSDET